MTKGSRTIGGWLPAALALAVCLGCASTLAAQVTQDLGEVRLLGPDGGTSTLSVSEDRGFAAVTASALGTLGWTAEQTDTDWTLRHSTGLAIDVRPGWPFFRWGSEWKQMVDSPFESRGSLWLPLQLVTDFLPALLPDAYLASVDGEGEVEIQVLDRRHWALSGGAVLEPRLVIIDPGHGGRDLGALGPGGTQEKDVALSVGLELARLLEADPMIEVRMTRDDDTFIPLWRRGEWATEVKEDRYALFLSLHANSRPGFPGTRGFETYFLSDARTEHERRVAANENTPIGVEGGISDASGGEDLDFILKELRNLDHQHWSALLAEMVQDRVAPVHPGPDRGVKQAPLAVITNALMPAVLVELGYISHRTEERVLAQEAFHRDVASALAEAVGDFFRRYPPGEGARWTAEGATGGIR